MITSWQNVFHNNATPIHLRYWLFPHKVAAMETLATFEELKLTITCDHCPFSAQVTVTKEKPEETVYTLIHAAIIVRDIL